MLCQGDAGVGKTYTVKALQQTIPAHLTIRGLAPSATAAEELQRGTNIPCQTIDAYLQTPFKSLNKNELIAVDEAGMIGSSQMQALLERAKQTNSRLLLIGDTKQLAAVQAGCPFRLLQEQAKLPTVRIDKNVRQQNLQLKEVVDLLAAGQIEKGYQQLNTNNSLSITQGDRELEFDSNNATVRNTFSAPQMESQIKARTNEMQQHIQIKQSKTQEWTISR